MVVAIECWVFGICLFPPDAKHFFQPRPRWTLVSFKLMSSYLMYLGNTGIIYHLNLIKSVLPEPLTSGSGAASVDSNDALK